LKCLLGCRDSTTYRDDHIHLQGDFSKLLGASFGATKFDSDGLPIEPSEFAQVLNESGSPVVPVRPRAWA
jgi:hypothetical protein